MSAAAPIYFIDDRCHIDVATTIFTSSSTASGYAVDNTRETDLVKPWKPNDGTADEWLKADGGSAGWLGGGFATIACCVAYDARAADQNIVRLQVGVVDDGAFATPADFAVFTLNKTRVACDYSIFTGPGAPGRRYWRLAQLNSDRSGGTRPAKILNLALFQIGGIVRIGGTEYPKDTPGESDIQESYQVAMARTAGGVPISNKYSETGQRVMVRYSPATDAMQTALRDLLFLSAGSNRNIYAQLDGLSNPPKADFFMVRLLENWTSSRRFVGQLETTLSWHTAQWL